MRNISHPDALRRKSSEKGELLVEEATRTARKIKNCLNDGSLATRDYGCCIENGYPSNSLPPSVKIFIDETLERIEVLRLEIKQREDHLRELSKRYQVRIPLE